MSQRSKIICYCRKSSESEDRQMLSIDKQISECTRLARIAGIEPNEMEFITESKSAKKAGLRKKFSTILKQIQQEKIHTIITYKVDRLARNNTEGGSIIDSLNDGLLAQVITTEGAFNTESNKLLASILIAQSTQYSQDLSYAVKGGIHEKLRQGGYPAPAPIGYLNITENNKPKIVKDPERFELIKEAWKLKVSGKYSTRKILEILNNKGFRTPLITKNTDIDYKKQLGGGKLSLNALRRIFENPFYYGAMKYSNYVDDNGNYYMGNHYPMITKKIFDTVQSLNKRKVSPKGEIKVKRKNKPRFYPFKDMLKCPFCGCSIFCNVATNRHGNTYYYYRCTHGKDLNSSKCPNKQYVELSLLDFQLLHIIRELDWSSKLTPVIKKAFLDKLKEKRVFDESIQKNIDTALKSIEAREKELWKVKINPSMSMDNDMFIKLQNELATEKKLLQIKKESTEKNKKIHHEALSELFNVLDKPEQWYPSLSTDELNTILSSMATNLQLEHYELLYEWKPPFNTLSEYKYQQFWDEWSNTREGKREIENANKEGVTIALKYRDPDFVIIKFKKTSSKI